MNDMPLSVTTKNLFAAAKADVPSAAARTKVWTGVSASVGGAAIVGASGLTGSLALTGGAGATKLLTIGALFGGTVAVGLATAVIQLRPVPMMPNTTLGQNEVAVAASTPPARAATEPAWFSSPSAAPGAGPAEIAPRTKPATHVHGAASHARPVAHEDALAREASLVAEARSALGRGDPRTALRVIRSARALPSRQLVPEELAVEEHALRALGRSDEANGIDVQLRLEYPEAALAR
jgi:predicted lipid-binding transport protein (Tim44 family)